MYPLRFAFVCLVLPLAAAPAAAATGWSDDDLDYVLERYVTEAGLVDYGALVEDRKPLDRFVTELGRISPDSHPDLFSTREHRLAYWMNAYNALMLHRVVEAWPVESVRRIRALYGVFWLERHELGGKRWTLRGLENEIIRERFGDPRIHFAINCASRGCPALPRRAWRAETLDRDLDAAARRFIADEANVRFDSARRVVALSSIFKWFEDDFTAPGRSVLDYVLHYVPDARRAVWGDPDMLEVEWIPYDWSINDAR